MYSKQELIFMNDTMLGRGAPIVDDGVGYNKPDFVNGMYYTHDLTDIQAYFLSSTLIKYCETQNIGDKENMKETVEHYRSIVEENTNPIDWLKENSIYLRINEDNKTVDFMFRFNYEIQSILRSHGGRFQRENGEKYWSIPILKTPKALEELKEDGYDVDMYIELVNQYIMDNELDKQTDNQVNDKLEISVVNVTDDKVDLKFDYDLSVVNTIKNLPYKTRSWNGYDKAWTVSRISLKELCESLDSEKVDYTALEKHIIRQNTIKDIRKHIEEVNNIAIHIRCENTMMEGLIRQLPMQYLENNNGSVYSMPRSYLPQLIEMMKGSGIETNYEEMEKYVKEKKESLSLMDTSMMNPLPRDYQIEGSKFLLQERKAILADKMGLGKSKTLLMACESVERAKKLLVCPSTIKIKLKQEIYAVNPNAKIEIITAKGGWDAERVAQADYIVINYDLLKKHKKDINIKDFKVLAVDESHKIGAIDNYGKPSSIRAKEILEMGEQTEYFFQLTGTPVRNHMKSYFNLLKGAECDVAFSWRHFAFNYTDAQNNGYGYTFTGSQNEETLHEYTSSKVLRRVNQTAEKVTKQFIPLEMSQSVHKKYKAIEKQYENVSYDNALAYYSACKHYLAQAKVPQTIEFISDMLEQDMTVVVFTAYNKVIDDIVKAFDNDKSPIQGEVRVIRGGTPENLREQYRDELNERKAKLLVGNIQAMGEGIDLDKVDVGIANDLTYVFTELEQAEYRLERMTRTEHANFYYMYCDNIDFDVYLKEMIEQKWQSSEKVLTGDMRQQQFFKNMYAKLQVDKEKEKTIKEKNRTIETSKKSKKAVAK